MNVQQIALETTERRMYQIPKLERHGEYMAKVGIIFSTNSVPNQGEFWDTSAFWDNLDRPIS